QRLHAAALPEIHLRVGRAIALEPCDNAGAVDDREALIQGALAELPDPRAIPQVDLPVLRVVIPPDHLPCRTNLRAAGLDRLFRDLPHRCAVPEVNLIPTQPGDLAGVVQHREPIRLIVVSELLDRGAVPEADLGTVP